MSLVLTDESLQNVVTAPVQGVRYVLLRTREGSADRTFSSSGAQLVAPPGVALPVASLPGQWNPSGTDGAPGWAIITDGYALQFTSTGTVTVAVGSESQTFQVQLPAVEEEVFTVKVLQWDMAWLHTVFVCELRYSGTSGLVRLKAKDVGTGRILMADIEKSGDYEFASVYDDATGDAIVHITPAPSTPITTRAVILGDTR
jgi:hypothetical protein